MIDLSYRDINNIKQIYQETANSYVIREPGDYCFPLIYGCGIKRGKINTECLKSIGKPGHMDFYDYKNSVMWEVGIEGIKTVDIVSWDSSRWLIQNLKLEKDYISFSVPYVPIDGANYVISGRDSSGVIVWSWHIWLYSDKLEDVDIGGGYKILNVNLATKGNKSWYYQWGRKDPICPYLKHVKMQFSPAVSIGQAISNPDILYKCKIGKNDGNWATVGTYLNYWNINAEIGIGYDTDAIDMVVIKTVYDPCPRGYTIPRYGAFVELSREFNNIQAFPDKRQVKLKNQNIMIPLNGIITGGSIKYELSNEDETWFWVASGFEERRHVAMIHSYGSITPHTYGYCANACTVRPQVEEIDKLKAL